MWRGAIPATLLFIKDQMLKYISFVDLWEIDRGRSMVEGNYSRDTLFKKANDWINYNKDVRIINIEIKTYQIAGLHGAYDGELILYYEV
jgi:hypothetical protein